MSISNDDAVEIESRLRAKSFASCDSRGLTLEDAIQAVWEQTEYGQEIERHG